MEITTQQIQEKFGTLPETLQLAIIDAKVDEHIMEIGAQNKITIEQMGELSLATHMVILGFVMPDKFESLVQELLKLPKEKVQKLINEVNENIIKKIRGNMMAETAPKTATPTQPMQTNTTGATQQNTSIPDPASTVHTLKDDMQTLKNAGIELMPDVKNAPNAHNVVPIPKPTPVMPPSPTPTPSPTVAQPPVAPQTANTVDREEMLKQEWHLASGGPTPPKSIEAQKFAGTFQIPKTQTDYAMKNITKVATPAPTLNKDPKSGTDPYREVIE